jgi:hypothetical protein
MNRMQVSFRRRPSLLVALLAALVFLSPATQAFVQGQGSPNPRIAPPNSRPYGLTYGEWAAEWWKWALGIQLAENPLIDETGEFADVDQAGPVWFLAGNFGGTTERTISIPTGKALFFPLVNAVLWDPEDLPMAVEIAEMLGLDPDDLTTEELLRVAVNFAIDATTDLSLTIDGQEIQDLFAYRADSPAFLLVDADLAEDLGYPHLDSRLSVADGCWIMLAPLPPGEHTIRLTAANSIFSLELDITYHLTVTSRQP